MVLDVIIVDFTSLAEAVYQEARYYASDKGRFSWRGEPLRCGPPLANQLVGLRQSDEDEWEVFYGPLLLGYVLIRNGRAVLERLT